MTLGIIEKGINETAFAHAAGFGLDFVEFCVNGDCNEADLLEHIPELKDWMKKYGVAIGSIGRWKTTILDESGNIVPEEQELAKKLMSAAAELGCDNYVCGCNYCEKLSLDENIRQAVSFFSQVLADRPQGMKVSVYNCWKMNFVDRPEIWTRMLPQLPELGIKYDPSHAINGGRDYLRELLDWGDRAYHVHLKGSMVIDGEHVDDPPAGMDQTNWLAVLAILRAKGYDRGLSIEPHSPVWKGALGEKGIAYTVEYFDSLLVER